MKDKILSYIRAGYPGLFIVSAEEQRVQGIITQVVKDKKLKPAPFKLFAWSVTQGIVDLADPEHPMPLAGTNPPVAMLNAMMSDAIPHRSVVIARDLHMYLAEPNPQLFRAMKDALAMNKATNRVLVIVGCQLKLPPELEKEITVVEFKLPDREQLLEVAQGIAESAGVDLNGNTDAVLDAGSGLTTSEAESAFALSIVETGDFDARVIMREKAATLKKGGLLEIVETKLNRDSVGGLQFLMDWVVKRKAAFTKKAREYGLPIPKGMLLVGVPGCGKSLVAKVTANILGVPLLKLDAGTLFGSLVGQSEQNLRAVIQTAEAIAPCVLWIDEVEKGFSGSKSSGSTDGGTAARVFGTFLQWMQEKTASVFVVATANDITSLPAEFQRKGRFDELWFADLPNETERGDIWKIVIDKFGRKPKDFDLAELVESTAEWTGAEIEALFCESMFAAFDEDKEPDSKRLIALTKEVKPLSTTMGDTVKALRAWAEGRARRASANDKKVAGGRRLA